MRDDPSVDLHAHKNTLLTALLAHSLRLKSEAQCGIISSRKATKANVSCGVSLFGLAEQGQIKSSVLHLEEECILTRQKGQRDLYFTSFCIFFS